MSSSQALTARLAEGEADAFEAVYDRFGGRLYAWLRVLVGDPQEAEDLLQVVMLRLVRHRARLRGVENLQAWLFAVARNEARRRGRRRGLPMVGDAALQGLAHPVGASTDAAALRRALSALAPPRLEVVLLKLHHDLTFREIAEVLDLPANTAASRYRRALEDLRRMLETADVER